MAPLDILPAQNPVDFDYDHVSRSPLAPSPFSRSLSLSHSHSYKEKILIHAGAAAPPADPEHRPEGDGAIPGLPPLLHGHPDVHLRRGVMAAAQLALAGEPDAEKAFFVADLSAVYRQHEKWKALLPEIEPCYAIKCNPDPYVLRLLAALGTGFDCASLGEIARVLEAGVDPARIIFANPCKATSFVRGAARAGVHTMTFDNADELHKIARVDPAARLVVRILTDDSRSVCRLGTKFGAPLAAVPGLLATARALRLDVVGVSFHVGSGCYDATAFADAVRRAREAFDMGRAAGYTFGLLDVGGGFEDSSFEATATVLMDAIERHFPQRDGLRIIAEPGRYYVAKAFSLAANIIARRAPEARPAEEVAAEEEDADAAGPGPAQPSVMYYINDGVYGSFNCILFDHQTPSPYVLSLDGSFHVPPSVGMQASSVWGPTCDAIDCVCAVTQLPETLRVGDWLGFENMGAYTVCAASQFNGFQVSAVVYTTGGGAGGAEVRRVLQGYGASRAVAAAGGA